MLLRKMVVSLCPLLVCIAVCTVFRWLDGWLGSTSFIAFSIKGALLGVALALTLPAAGVRAHTSGLTGWLFLGAGLLGAALLYQYLETAGMVHVPVLQAIFAFNGQVVLVEAAAMGYLMAAGFLYRRR